ncbi:MAG: hypothetical protein QNJ20_01185 [Paracoccaceae bacterium]|nr:hypothetical protein [Paracoccaceae bacterium]
MTAKPIIRLHLFFATENDRAVILRQGPSRQFRMILWHRDTDTFEDGQWIKNKVYVERCALSPDGQHFLYFILDGKWNSDAMGSYSVLSKPPYWTALSLFRQGDTWTGHSLFIDNTHYFAWGGHDIIGRDKGLSRVTFGEPSKGCSTGIRLMTGGRAPLDRKVTKRVLADPRPTSMGEIYDRLSEPQTDALDRYDSQGGKLYRRKGMELELIRDFTEMEFEPIRAPYDWRPETPDRETAPWHPLNGDT